MTRSRPVHAFRSFLCFASLLVTSLLLCCRPGLAATDGAATPPSVLKLWPHGAPGALGTTDADEPSIEVHLPKSGAPEAAVIICPGGAYHHLAWDKEGRPAAAWLNARGVAAFILKYRLAPYRYPAPILDGKRAIRYVRAHAAEFGINPSQIGMWGFSAGGHVASTVATHFDSGTSSAKDPIDRVSSRPDFLILAYAVISMEDDLTHRGSRRNLLGEHPSPVLINLLSNELHVTPETPPTFIYHTEADHAVHVKSSLIFYMALVKNHVPAELHIFEPGEHGSALGQNSPYLAHWTGLLDSWMGLHGWITQSQSSVPCSPPPAVAPAG